MTRAYIRVDPQLVENLEAKGYPDAAIVTFLAILGAAEDQSPRGRFRNLRVLHGFLQPKRVRWVGYLISHGDLVVEQSGAIYVIGWDEWQEGNILVAERMRIVRARQASNNGSNGGSNRHVTNDVTVGVTVPSELARVFSRKPLAVSREPRVRAEEAAVDNSLSRKRRDPDHDVLLKAWYDLTSRQPNEPDEAAAATTLAAHHRFTVPARIQLLKAKVATFVEQRKRIPAFAYFLPYLEDQHRQLAEEHPAPREAQRRHDRMIRIGETERLQGQGGVERGSSESSPPPKPGSDDRLLEQADQL